MYRHPLRKSLGLIVLYSVIIIGIFVLQFRNESVISKSVGLLSVSFAQSQNEEGEISLKNSLQVAFKGISFTADEVSPARLAIQGAEPENLVLLAYEQKTPLSFTFWFTHDVALTFAVTDTDSSAALSVTAELPDGAEGLLLQYKPTSGFSVTEKTQSKLILNSKNLTYAFTAAQIDDTSIFLSARNFIAYYVAYDPSVVFSFSSLDSDMIMAQKSTYEANIKSFRANLVSSVAESIRTNQSLSEKSVIAYVAELASQGRYAEAVGYVPDSFKKGNKRTYLSAPYFNTLNAMLPTFEMHNANMAELLTNALNGSSLSVFSVEGFADYLHILPESAKIRSLLELPATLLENESTAEQVRLTQASGILSTYLRLASLHSELADILFPAAQKCLSIIEASCVLNDSLLTLVEQDAPASNFLALKTGNALVQWGELHNSAEHAQAGYAIINSILSVNSLDAITLADVYPILVSNDFYPHYSVLSRSATGIIWAWTCVPAISYSTQAKNATISIRFPAGEVHHAFVFGIRPFTEIEIYGVSFHSDPRFESYNSSGFIYNEEKNVLLLKSRHKTESEVVRFAYR